MTVRGTIVMGVSRRALAAGLVAAFCLFTLTGSAQAISTHEFTFGSGGSGAGQLNRPMAIALDESNNTLYVADELNHRLQQFDLLGSPLRAFGYDVVQSGPSNQPFVDEIQHVRIKATSGAYSITFGGQTTGQIPFDAPAAGAGSVEEALNSLPSINAGGGSVSVSGGPGDETGSTPYVVTFDGGPLAGTNVSSLIVNRQHLGYAVGTELTCVVDFVPQVDYQWLRNGVEIPGATSSTYTTVAEDGGKAIQCKAIGNNNNPTVGRIGIPGPFNDGHPVQISPVPDSGTFPPIPTASNLNTPAITSGGTLTVGSAGGHVLTCNAGTSWTNSPTSYTYDWYRNGYTLLESDTKAENSDTYTVTEEDLAEPAGFQCVVTAHNAAGSSSIDSNVRNSSPSANTPVTNPEAPLPTELKSSALPDLDGGAVFEICTPTPPTEDVCKAGVSGIGAGQFSSPTGVAVDNSEGPATGSIYVQDRANRRIQRFTPEGAFERMWGREVNRNTGGNICTAESGDYCQIGQAPLNLSGGLASTTAFTWNSASGSGIAVDDLGRVYVVDEAGSVGGRVERFDSAGVLLDQLIPPLNRDNWRTMAVSPSTHTVYLQATGPNSVVQFDASDFSAEGTGATVNAVIADSSTGITGSWALAIDPTNEYLQLGDINSAGTGCAEGDNYAIWQFDPAGNVQDCTRTLAPYIVGSLSTGMVVTPARKLYVADRVSHNVKVFDLPDEEAPEIPSEEASQISTNSATVAGFINPNFSETDYKIEIGPAPCSTVPNPCSIAEEGGPLRGTRDIAIGVDLSGLSPNTDYHYRLVAENGVGEEVGPDRRFKTYAAASNLADPCPNALARQQTKAALMLDCRAYELVSAEYAGGYDVTSDLIEGQQPFGGYPAAADRVLYSVVDGGIPETGLPTNRGPDPYVATRGSESWNTTYVGIPSNINPLSPPFSSTLAEATAGLDAFAFGGSEICNPCFPNGSTGIPLRLPDGSLVQGMQGSLPVAAPVPSGQVNVHFSEDGSHFVFASKQQFENDGNPNNGHVTIYDRNLETGVTQVVSKTPGGATMAGGEDVAQLDISADGNRVLFGDLVGTDAQGNRFWDLYMHVGTSAGSVLIADTANGALYNGMSSDGATVYFSTAAALAGDSDEGVDLFRADVGPSSATVSRVSAGSGGSGQTDACSPTDDWNTVEPPGEDCSVVAVGGLGGVARDSGHAYFFSPERLDGPANGTDGEPNLYRVAPSGAPDYVTTLEADNPAVEHSVLDNEERNTGGFQVTSHGSYAVFTTALPLDPDYDNDGKRMVYRHDGGVNTLQCVSCRPSGERPTGAASLASKGLSVLEDGRVFFNTPDALVLRDTSGKQDAYEWTEGDVQLISTGVSAFAEGLLSASEDGKDVFFYTRETIVPSDRNGQAVKIYDAREGGGYFLIPQGQPCAASDECHGPSSQATPPPRIGTFKGTGGQHKGTAGKARRCRAGSRKRRIRGKARCVRRNARKKRQRGNRKRQGARARQGGNR